MNLPISFELIFGHNRSMCRLFGFRSILESQVHSSLVSADNALGVLSKKHSDGWGVAYYVDSVPHVIKSLECAIEDKIFHQISGVVASQSVLAHIRKATQGQNNILNSHPFQYGKWTFAHNGNVKNYAEKKDQLLKLVSKQYRPFILGETDSEVIFYIILSQISLDHICINTPKSTTLIAQSIATACKKICDVIGALTDSDDPCPTENYLTFILSNGKMLFALQAGQPLFFSTHKSLCPERSSCKFFDKSCESPSKAGEKVNHLILSSEALQGANLWNELDFGSLIAVDGKMELYKEKIELPKV